MKNRTYPAGSSSPSNTKEGKAADAAASASLGGGHGKPFVPKKLPCKKSGKP